MCVNTCVVPLVNLRDKKRKILFQYTFDKSKITDIDILNNFRSKFERALLQVKNHSQPDELTASLVKTIKNVGNIESFDSFVSIPCGHCSECLKVNARNWAIRILEECENFKHNYFLTITYNDDFLPRYGSLVKEDVPKFNKKLKTILSRKNLNSKFRYYAVGEYGGQTYRPHMHGIYFNLDLPDLKFTHYSKNGFPCYESTILNQAWSVQKLDENGKHVFDENGKPVLISKGFIEVQDVSLGSACYVARYCDKKRNLTRDDLDNLKLFNLEPEFSIMSRRPGIGSSFYEKLKNNVLNGVYSISYKDNKFSIPKYYKNKLLNDLSYEDLKDFKDYNKLISDNISYNYMALSEIVDLNDLLIYNENDKKTHKNKRGF